MFRNQVGARPGASDAARGRFVSADVFAQAEQRAAVAWAPRHTDEALDQLIRRSGVSRRSPASSAAQTSPITAQPQPSPRPPSPLSRGSTPSRNSAHSAQSTHSAHNARSNRRIDAWELPEGAGHVAHFRAQLGQSHVDSAFAWRASIVADKDVVRSIEQGAPIWKVTFDQSDCGSRTGRRAGCMRFALDGELATLLDAFANTNRITEVRGHDGLQDRPVLQFSDGVPVWTENPEQLHGIVRRLNELLDRQMTVDASASGPRRNAGVPSKAWNWEVPKNEHPAVQALYYNVIQATRTGAKQTVLEEWKNRQLNDVVNRLGGAATHEEFVRKICYAMITNTESRDKCGKALFKILGDTKRALTPQELTALRRSAQ